MRARAGIATLLLLALAAGAAAQPGSALRVTDADSVAAARPTAPSLLGRPRVSPTAAVFTSAVFPGWGQLATDNAWRAALAFGFEGWFLARVVTFDRRAERYRDRIEPLRGADGFEAAVGVYGDLWEIKRDNAWWAGGALFFIALDAYVGAHLDRFDEDPVHVPDAWDPGDIPQPIELPPATGGGAPILRLSAGF
ncbi:MAG TPA: DUF5683 domain-containing protein [Candidatus Krumholzibacteria bacterium]|nr:DUF5683 domain-containing protein [Candidatus Krumholzibacteria bacterium]